MHKQSKIQLTLIPLPVRISKVRIVPSKDYIESSVEVCNKGAMHPCLKLITILFLTWFLMLLYLPAGSCSVTKWDTQGEAIIKRLQILYVRFRDKKPKY